MSTITEYFKQAELALAAYARLDGIVNLIDPLKEAGMTQSQAEHFARDWRVVEQYNGEIIDDYIDEFGNPQQATILTGLSATVFQEMGSGRRYLAVRGTAGLADLLTDLTDIALLGTPERQLQYAALKAKVGKWLDDGILSPGFSVSGHSLGGFLAGALLVDYATSDPLSLRGARICICLD
jgi:hypothetical protein